MVKDSLNLRKMEHSQVIIVVMLVVLVLDQIGFVYQEQVIDLTEGRLVVMVDIGV